MKVGFIGLGQMGLGMARRLLDAGHELIAYNRSHVAAGIFGNSGAAIALQPDEVLAADVVITMLADDAAVEAVWITPGLIGRMPAAGIHLNMASVSLQMGKRLTALHSETGSRYVAAPVFGRPPVAAAGGLDIVAAGAAPAIARCMPLFEALGRQTFVIGTEPWQANIVKIARNYLLATAVEGLGEALALVRKSGVDAAQFVDVITSTSFSAPAYKNYGRLMVERNFDAATFTLRLGLKDVEIALEAARETQVPLPIAGVIRAQHLGAIERGLGEKDWAALAGYLAGKAGLGDE